MDTTTMFAIRQLVESPARGSKGNVVASKQLALALRAVRAMGQDAYEYALAIVLANRQGALATATAWQREWGSRVSKRPGRGNHHDSWAIREKYIRCHGSDTDYIGYSNRVLTEHPGWEVTGLVRYPRRKDRI